MKLKNLIVEPDLPGQALHRIPATLAHKPRDAVCSARKALVFAEGKRAGIAAACTEGRGEPGVHGAGMHACVRRAGRHGPGLPCRGRGRSALRLLADDDGAGDTADAVTRDDGRGPELRASPVGHRKVGPKCTRSSILSKH